MLPYYSILEREADEVFPILFEVAIPVRDDEIGSGRIEAFSFLVYQGADFELISIR